MAGLLVLIVEDEFLIRLTLAEALTDAGFSVLEAETASDAFAALESHPDMALMLTDIQLRGGTSGVELVQSIRAEMPELPVIFMSGRPDSLSGIEPSARDAFIAKPYLPSEVCAAARRLTGN
jgi:DNA-binding response OmpR family regulator